MKIAVTAFDNRISPVYAVAKEILLVVFEDEQEVSRIGHAFDRHSATRRVQHLTELGIDVLICGGITGSQVRLLQAAGITVVGHVAGNVDQVIKDYLAGTLDSSVDSEPCSHSLLGGTHHE